jgi:flavorubredoxin
MQMPDDPEKVAVDSENVYPLAPDVQVVRGTCRCRLRSEVEYMAGHGTSDNSYLITVSNRICFFDVQCKQVQPQFHGFMVVCRAGQLPS